MGNDKKAYLPLDEVHLEAIENNVEFTRNIAAELGTVLGFKSESIQWMDEFIERNRAEMNETMKENIVNLFGSYLGESMVNEYDGEWALAEGTLCVRLVGNITAYPIAKVRKQIFDGPEDSIFGFYIAVSSIQARTSTSH